MDMWKNDLDEDRESLRTIRHSTGEHALEMKEVSASAVAFAGDPVGFRDDITRKAAKSDVLT